VKEPAWRPVSWTDRSKVSNAAMLSPGPGKTMIAEIMLEVEGILPITVFTFDQLRPGYQRLCHMELDRAYQCRYRTQS